MIGLVYATLQAADASLAWSKMVVQGCCQTRATYCLGVQLLP